jgi:hypothetical protein
MEYPQCDATEPRTLLLIILHFILYLPPGPAQAHHRVYTPVLFPLPLIILANNNKNFGMIFPCNVFSIKKKIARLKIS